MLKLTAIIIFTLFPALVFSAEKIARTQDKEGVVEFSNIPAANNSGKTTLIYTYPDGDKVSVFTDQKPTHTSDYNVLKFECYACNPHSKINWYKVKLNINSFSQAIDLESKSNNIDPALIRALIHAESAFNSQATSRVGAQGLMQLMPATAKELGVTNSLDAQQNIAGGTKYIAQLLQQFHGNIKLATAAYNAGPAAVQKYNGVPPYEETQVYVKRVAILHARYQQAL
ncbi:MAG: lytic transglycosylase domain-containing protein [Methylophaga sp.]|nr:lytic transglycosylase domain-containing protein [Methylophaga sp.]